MAGRVSCGVSALRPGFSGGIFGFLRGPSLLSCKVLVPSASGFPGLPAARSAQSWLPLFCWVPCGTRGRNSQGRHHWDHGSYLQTSSARSLLPSHMSCWNSVTPEALPWDWLLPVSVTWHKHLTPHAPGARVRAVMCLGDEVPETGGPGLVGIRLVNV